MMDEAMTPSDRAVPVVPWPVWLLLIGAIVQLVVQVVPDSYQLFGPYFLVDAPMVMEWLQGVSLFLLPAAIVLAMDRWPAGRRALVTGAAALALAAVLRTANDLWWVLWEASGATWEVNQPWLVIAYGCGALLFAIGLALVAAGLWASRAQVEMSAMRTALMAVIGLGAIVATGSGLWVVARTFGLTNPDAVVPATVTGMLAAAGFAALGTVALAAVRATPARGGLPEMMIAGGAFAVMAATAWTWAVPYSSPGLQQVSEVALIWVYTVPYWISVLGTLTMIAGFGLAAFRGRPGRIGGEPTA